MSGSEPAGEQQSFYEAVGGEQTFHDITKAFYVEVANNELLRTMYPEDDLGPAERRLRMFLEQYWGGPRTYTEERGHPRLRMRHHPYKVDGAARDAWLDAMRKAIATVPADRLDDAHRKQLLDYMEMAANGMINAPE